MKKIICLNKVENDSNEKPKGGMKADIRELLISVLQGLAIFAVLAAFAGLLILFCRDYQAVDSDLRATINQEKVMKQSITEGVITDKKIENGKVTGNIFTQSYVPTTYRIYVTNDYKFEDKVYTGEVYFEVNEDIYNSYSIGEWFDSQDLNKD